MSADWELVVAAGLAVWVIRAAGPLALGGREMERALARLERLPPALLAALAATQTFAHAGSLAVDARLAGLLAASVAAALRAPPIVILGVAVAATALARSMG
jgi:branched-subunit amino acid transport protein